MSTQWFYRVSDQEHGPVEGKTLKLLAEVGQITVHTLVRKAESKSWTEAKHVKQLFDPQSAPALVPPVLEQPVKVKPAARVRAVEETPPPPVIEALNTSPSPGIPIAVHHGESTSKQGILKSRQKKKNTWALILTLTGFIMVAIPAVWLLYENPFATESSRVTTDIDTAANLSTQQISKNGSLENTTAHDKDHAIQDALRGVRAWQDATEAKINIAGDAAVTITQAWLDPSTNETGDQDVETTTGILTVVVKTENLDSTAELSLQRQFANQNTHSNIPSLNPYLPLAQSSNGDAAPLQLEAPLQNRVVPVGGFITETFLFKVDTRQIEPLHIAIPRAWFNKSGYLGFEIPRVMIAAAEPRSSTVTDKPIQVANQPTGAKSDAIVKPPEGTGEPQKPVSPDNTGQLPPSPFGTKDQPPSNPAQDPKNGDQPGTIQDLQSEIRNEKNRDKDPPGDPKPR